MAMTVGQIMRTINNFFEHGYRATNYSIAAGVLSPQELLRPGMWIAITGSIFHDGVWQLGEGCTLGERSAGLTDEKFFGRVWFLHPPASFLETCKRISEFVEKTPVSGVQSESFGEFSQTAASGKNGGVLTWQEAFEDDLRPYRSMYTEVF